MAAIDTHQPPRVRSFASLTARRVDEGAIWTLELSGEADIGTLMLLREELAEGVGVNRPRFVIDMAGLRFCDVRSAELIMSVSRTSPVSLTGAAGSVKRVLDLLDSGGRPSHPAPRAQGKSKNVLRGTRHADACRTPGPRIALGGSAVASTLAPVVASTLAPVVSEEPPIRCIPPAGALDRWPEGIPSDRIR